MTCFFSGSKSSDLGGFPHGKTYHRFQVASFMLVSLGIFNVILAARLPRDKSIQHRALGMAWQARDFFSSKDVDLAIENMGQNRGDEAKQV